MAEQVVSVYVEDRFLCKAELFEDNSLYPRRGDVDALDILVKLGGQRVGIVACDCTEPVFGLLEFTGVARLVFVQEK